MLQKYSFFLYFCTKEVFLLAHKGHTRNFILTRNLKYLKPNGSVSRPYNICYQDAELPWAYVLWVFSYYYADSQFQYRLTLCWLLIHSPIMPHFRDHRGIGEPTYPFSHFTFLSWQGKFVLQGGVQFGKNKIYPLHINNLII